MTNTSDDGRVSTIHDRPRATEVRFLALCRALAPLQAYDAGRRSVATGADGRGGVPEMTATERASDAGDLRRASAAYARLGRVPMGDARATLVWLATYAHAGDLATLGALYGSHAAPMALREAAQSTPWAASKASAAHTAAKRRASAAPTSQTLAALRDARALAEDTAARELTARTALAAWGVAALSAAVEAWERADTRDEAA